MTRVCRADIVDLLQTLQRLNARSTQEGSVAQELPGSVLRRSRGLAMTEPYNGRTVVAVEGARAFLFLVNGLQITMKV